MKMDLTGRNLISKVDHHEEGSTAFCVYLRCPFFFLTLFDTVFWKMFQLLKGLRLSLPKRSKQPSTKLDPQPSKEKYKGVGDQGLCCQGFISPFIVAIE